MPPPALLACSEAPDGAVERAADGAPDWPQPAVRATKANVSTLVRAVTARRVRNLAEPPGEGLPGAMASTVRAGKPTGITSRQPLTQNAD
jgi:hypothetical protein